MAELYSPSCRHNNTDNCENTAERPSSTANSTLNNSSSFSSTGTPPLSILTNNNKPIATQTNAEKQEPSMNSSTSFSSTNSVIKSENYLLSQQIQPITSSATSINVEESAINKLITTNTISVPISLNSIPSFGISKGVPITMNSLTDSVFDEKKQEILNNDLNQLKNLTNKIRAKFIDDTFKTTERRVNGAAKLQTGTLPTSDLRQLADAARAEIINSQANLKREKLENLIKEVIPNTTNNDVKMMECDSSVPSPKPVVLSSIFRQVEKIDPLAKLDNMDNKKVLDIGSLNNLNA